MELMILIMMGFGVMVGLAWFCNVATSFRAEDVDNYQLIKILRKEKNK